MTPKRTFTESEVIDMLRNGQGQMSGKEYAAHVGVSQQYLSDMLQGRRPPGPLVLKHLKLEKVFRRID